MLIQHWCLPAALISFVAWIPPFLVLTSDVFPLESRGQYVWIAFGAICLVLLAIFGVFVCHELDSLSRWRELWSTHDANRRNTALVLVCMVVSLTFIYEFHWLNEARTIEIQTTIGTLVYVFMCPQQEARC